MTLWRNKVDITRVTKFQCKRLCKNSFTLCSLQFLEKYEYIINTMNIMSYYAFLTYPFIIQVFWNQSIIFCTKISILDLNSDTLEKCIDDISRLL